MYHTTSAAVMGELWRAGLWILAGVAWGVALAWIILATAGWDISGVIPPALAAR